MGAFGLIYLALIERGGVVGTEMACKKAQPGVDSITTERVRAIVTPSGMVLTFLLSSVD